MYCIQSLVLVEQFSGLVVVNPLKLMLLLQPHLENPDFFVCRPNLSWQLFLYEKVTGLFTSDGSRAYRQRDDEVLGTEPPWSPGTEPLAGSTPPKKKSSTLLHLTVNFVHEHSRYAKSRSACYTSRCQWGSIHLPYTGLSSVTSRQHLLSARRGLLVVPRHRLSSYGRRPFSVAGPAIWNWLPDTLRDLAISRDSFKHSLKTFLFSAYSCT